MKSAKAQLEHRFAASGATAGRHELCQLTPLTVACVARGYREVEELLDGAERYLSAQEWELGSREREVVTLGD